MTDCRTAKIVLALAVLLASPGGVLFAQPAEMRSPEWAADAAANQAVRNWLDCRQCGYADLALLRQAGPLAIPKLREVYQTADQLLHSRGGLDTDLFQLRLYARQLRAQHRRLDAAWSGLPGAPDEDEFVERYLRKRLQLYRARSERALWELKAPLEPDP